MLLQWPLCPMAAPEKSRPALPALLLLLTLIVGCAPGQQRQAETDAVVPVLPAEPGQTEQLGALEKSPFELLFAEAEAALARHDWMAAMVAMPAPAAVGPEPSGLTQESAEDAPFPAGPEPGAADPDPAFLAHLAWVRAAIAFERGDLEATDRWLAAALVPAAPDSIRARALQLRYRRHRLNENFTAAAEAAYDLHRLRGSAGTDPARVRLWRALQQAPIGELRTGQARSGDSDWRGWLALAELSRTADSQAALKSGLDRWQAAFPEHPGGSPLPPTIAAALTSAAPAQHVAVMLPLSGRIAPAARAVRDGLLAARFADGDSDMTLRFIDTGRYENAADAYVAAADSGAELAIGPLTKLEVSALNDRGGLPVPVLALNRAMDNVPSLDPNLMQLSLAPEDEAQQIAQLAYGQGRRRALLIAPTGDWGEKMSRALESTWTELGGTIPARADFTDRESYSDAITSALAVTASDQRGRAIRRLFRQPVELEQRRRQDLDVVFLLAPSPIEARSLKPLLDYHFAGDLPVWSTSAVNAGQAGGQERDLEGLQLVEMPWLLGRGGAAQRLIDDRGDSGAYNRLHALGVDAYQLVAKVALMQGAPNAIFTGTTGRLALGRNGQFQRALTPAVFDRRGLRPR